MMELSLRGFTWGFIHSYRASRAHHIKIYANNDDDNDDDVCVCVIAFFTIIVIQYIVMCFFRSANRIAEMSIYY